MQAGIFWGMSAENGTGRGGGEEMLGWLQDLSPFSLAIVCSGSFVLLTWFGIVFVRPFLRLLLRRQAGANDLVSYTSSWFSLLYGLLLGLLSVATYQNAAQVQTSVQFRAQRLGAARMGALVQTLEAFEPTTKSQEIALEQMFANFDVLAEARIERLAGVSLAIPGVFWYVVLIGALINIVLIWMLEMRLFTHLILGGMISFFLGVMFFLLIAMDQPLRGAVAVSPTSYELGYRS